MIKNQRTIGQVGIRVYAKNYCGQRYLRAVDYGEEAETEFLSQHRTGHYLKSIENE